LKQALAKCFQLNKKNIKEKVRKGPQWMPRGTLGKTLTGREKRKVIHWKQKGDVVGKTMKRQIRGGYRKMRAIEPIT